MANPYAELQERVNRQAKPINVLLELTYRCNYDCTFCYNPKNLRKELTTDEVFSLLSELQGMSVLFLSLSGGEPTIRRDLLEIVGKARDLDFAVTIFTNGHLLTREKIRRFKDLGVLNLEISLHGPTAEVHDARVQVPGSFEKLRQVFGILAEEGQRTIIKSPVTKANFDGIVATWEYGRSFGHVVQFDTKITPTDEGDSSPLDQKIDADQLVVFWRDIAPRVEMNLPNRKRTLDPHENNCGVGTSTMVIDPYGFVFPCVQWRRPLGNVLETPVREIWSGTEVAEVRRVNREVNREAVLSLGPVADAYFSCPGLSLQKFGNPMAVDPDDLRRAEVLHELRAKASTKVDEDPIPKPME